MGISVNQKPGNKTLGQKKICDLEIGDWFELTIRDHVRIVQKTENGYRVFAETLTLVMVPPLDPELVVQLVPDPKGASPENMGT